MTRTPASLGEIVAARRVVSDVLDPKQVRTIVLLLAGSVALMMTGLGIIIPIFARRFEEMGGGVQELGLMTMAFALAQFLAAPVMGSLADRHGRRPFVLLALGSFALANVGFLLATSIAAFTVVRALEGALSAGLYPAAMGIVADAAPENERGRWIGIVMAGYGAGFILGPVLGGLLYDWLGYAAPFVASALMAAIAFVAALLVVPETRTPVVRRRERLARRREEGLAHVADKSLRNTLPRPIPVFAVLLLIEFTMVFAFAFIEPQMVFYLYDDLDWSTVRFGVLVAAYGLAVVVGQVSLGRLSDRFARKPIILIGLLLNATFYAALVWSDSFALMMATAVLSGIGEAMVLPALSAFVLDMTAEQHRSRAMGFKESAAAMGGVLGPLLVVGAATRTTPQGVFAIAAAAVLAVAIIGLLDMRVTCVGEECSEEAQAYAMRRALAAQATLRGIVTSASAARRS